jgi:two-component system response regulator
LSDNQNDVNECYHLGANSYVVKPTASDKFVAVMKLIATYWLSVNKSPYHSHDMSRIYGGWASTALA